MPRTRNDLVNEALMNLGVLAAGQTADAEDFEAVDGKVDGLVAWLQAATIFDLDTVDIIENEWFAPLAVLLADEAAREFGLPGIPSKPNEPSPRQKAIDDLILVQYGRPSYEPLMINYF